MIQLALGERYRVVIDRKQKLRQLVKRQAEVLGRLGNEGRCAQLEETAEDLDRDDFKVLVLGEFKRGKSTLINALLGAEVLPAFTLPCTAVINEVKWSERKRAVLHYKDPDRQGGNRPQKQRDVERPPIEIPIERLKEFVVIKDDEREVRESPYRKVEVFWPLPLCRNGVEIVDSPGLNEHDVRERVTMDYVNHVDAIVFVLSCQQPAARSEMQVIELIGNFGHDNVFFAWNYFDAVPETQREEIQTFGVRKLRQFTPEGSQRVFFLSARDALEGKLAGDCERVARSGIVELERALESFLAEERGSAKLVVRAKALRHAIRESRRDIPERRALLSIDADKLVERLRKAEDELHELENERDRIVIRVDAFIKDTSDLVRDKVRRYLDGLPRKVEVWATELAPQMQVSVMPKDADIKRLIEEVVTHLSEEVELDFSGWSAKEVHPWLRQRVGELFEQLEEHSERFLEHVQRVRAEIAGEEPGRADIVGVEQEAIDHFLAGAAELVGPASPGMKVSFGAVDIVRSFIPELALVGATVFFVGLNPMALIPAVLAGGILRQRIKNSAINRIKNEVANRFIGVVAEQSADSASEVAESMAVKLRELRDSINERLSGEIEAIQKRVGSVLEV